MVVKLNLNNRILGCIEPFPVNRFLFIQVTMQVDFEHVSDFANMNFFFVCMNGKLIFDFNSETLTIR